MQSPQDETEKPASKANPALGKKAASLIFPLHALRKGAPAASADALNHSTALTSPQMVAVNAEKPTVESPGEEEFRRRVYRDIGYWINLGGSVLFADFMLSGHGRPVLDAIAHGTHKGITGHFMEEAASKKTAFNAWKTLTLLSGGTVLLAPIKVLEDNKRRIVHWLNQKNGTADQSQDAWTTPEDQLPQIVEEPVKQTWWNAAKRRAFGMGIVVAGSQAVNYAVGNSRVENAVADTVSGGLSKTGVGLLEKLGKAMRTDASRGRRYIKLVTLDSVFTGITAATVYFTRPDEDPCKTGKAKPEDCTPEKALENSVNPPLSEPETPPAARFADKVIRREMVIPKENHADNVIAARNAAETQPGMTV